MAFVISVDPGLSTGVAIFQDGQLLESYTSKAPHDRLRYDLAYLDPDQVVCERGPANRRQAATCEPVEAIVLESSNRVVWVRPSAWKPSPVAVLNETDTPGTKHEKDAIRMGRWHLCR